MLLSMIGVSVVSKSNCKVDLESFTHKLIFREYYTKLQIDMASEAVTKSQSDIPSLLRISLTYQEEDTYIINNYR